MNTQTSNSLKLCFLTTFLVFAFVCVSQAQELRDIKPPVSFPPNFIIFWIIFFLTVLTGLIFLVRYFVLKPKQIKEVADIIRSPDEIARERLEALRQKGLQIEEYFVELSDIVRRYIEGRFQISAPEMTTEEFLWFLKDSGKLNLDHQLLLKQFLDCCDMVKFAKYGPSRQEMDDSFRAAEKFVGETRRTLDKITNNQGPITK